ncbi:MAG: SIS domain-containing protein [Capsulimonadaceae bacterium]
MANFIRGYLADVQRLLSEVDDSAVNAVVEALAGAWRDGKRVLLMGNGGSSSTVSHIVADLQKNIQLETGRALKTLCLTDSTPLLSAWANDTEWSNVFAPQVECWAERGDIVIGVSGSGNSSNVIRGIEAGNRAGAITFGLAGFEGGKLKATAQHCITVYSDNMQRIEDVHMILLHVIFSDLCLRLKSATEA